MDDDADADADVDNANANDAKENVKEELKWPRLILFDSKIDYFIHNKGGYFWKLSNGRINQFAQRG